MPHREGMQQAARLEVGEATGERAVQKPGRTPVRNTVEDDLVPSVGRQPYAVVNLIRQSDRNGDPQHDLIRDDWWGCEPSHDTDALAAIAVVRHRCQREC